MAACPDNYYNPPGSPYCFPTSSAPEGARVLNYSDGTPVQIEESDNSCNSLASCIADVVYLFTVGIGSAAAYIGAWIFGLAVALSLNSAAYALTFLTQGWTAVRDIANMFFVLVLVYIAFTIMFQANTHDTSRKLVWVIIVALVINFSFFFTRVVIDAGNLFAVQFYNAIEADPLSVTAQNGNLATEGVSAATGLTGLGRETKDLTSSIMNGIGLQKILGTTAFKNFQNQNKGVSGFFTTLITLSVLYIVLGVMLFMLAAAFLTVGIKFIVRIVVLWLLLIASPLALVANTIQDGKKYFQRWQSELIRHAFYPAFFLFIFYILTLFMQELTKNGNILEQTFSDLSQVKAGGLVYLVPMIATIAIRLGFVLVLLYVGLKASESMGVMGAHFAENVGKRVTSFAGGLPLRGAIAGTGAFGRNTVGWGGNYINRNANLRALDQAGGVKGFFARSLRTAGASVSNKTFDARNIPGAAKAFGVGGLVDVGTGKKGGYLDRLKASKEAKVKYAKGLEATDADKQRAEARTDRELNYADTKTAMEAQLADEKRELADLDVRLANMRSSGAGETEEYRKAKRERDARAAFIEQTEKGIKALADRRSARINELSGAGLTKKYAENNLLNPNALMSAGNPGFITMASRQAAAELLKKKNPKEEAIAALKALGEITDSGGHGGGDDHGGGGGKGGGGGSKSSGSSGSKTSATAKDSAGKGDSHGAHAMEEHVEKLVALTERNARRLEMVLKEEFHGVKEQLHQEGKRAEANTMRATSARISEAAATTHPVAAVPIAPDSQPSGVIGAKGPNSRLSQYQAGNNNPPIPRTPSTPRKENPIEELPRTGTNG